MTDITRVLQKAQKFKDHFGLDVHRRSKSFQTIQYITRSKIMETETRELSSVSRGKIKSNSTDDWKNEKLFVPPLPPTNLRGCHVIRIQYDVFVSAKKWAQGDRIRSPAFTLFTSESRLHKLYHAANI